MDVSGGVLTVGVLWGAQIIWSMRKRRRQARYQQIADRLGQLRDERADAERGRFTLDDSV
jgi:hypothetical protein